jgi:hypothetical protein
MNITKYNLSAVSGIFADLCYLSVNIGSQECDEYPKVNKVDIFVIFCYSLVLRIGEKQNRH